jgi:hypothetical protein
MIPPRQQTACLMDFADIPSLKLGWVENASPAETFTR